MLYRNNTTEVLLSLGSNIGNRKEFISKAVDLMKRTNILKGVRSSSFYETEPVGVTEQNMFLNIALKANTDVDIFSLLFLIKSTEYLIGRQKRKRWHEREIDIDIILFGDMVIQSEMLTVPHKEMKNRLFVLAPANEIAPDIIHPTIGKSINELLCSYNGNENVVKV